MEEFFFLNFFLSLPFSVENLLCMIDSQNSKRNFLDKRIRKRSLRCEYCGKILDFPAPFPFSLSKAAAQEIKT